MSASINTSSTGNLYYVIDNVNYDIQFPISLAIKHKEETGPIECNNCALYGTLNGVFYNYCSNCVAQYEDLDCLLGYSDTNNIGGPELTYPRYEEANKVLQEILDEMEDEDEDEDEEEKEKEYDISEQLRYHDYSIRNLTDVVYQFIGGLYNQETQTGILEYKLANLFTSDSANDSRLKKKVINTSKWGSCPTTRQGDENEKRIEELEKKVSELMNLIK